MTVAPLVLPPNQFHRFYAGGARIDAFRGVPAGEDGRPEDWIGSTATAFGEQAEGLSRVADGRLVRDLVQADPGALLGPAHVARFGADPGLLVKLLDAGERLAVHVHPGRAFARSRLGLPWGKTEAWLILHADPGASVHVGLREPIDVATLRRWVKDQDADEMLSALHELPVRAGSALLVPAGTLHAIGAGILLLECQEPTDLSVFVEWRSYGVSSGAEHLQLGWDEALAAIDRSAAGAPTFAAEPPDVPVAALLPVAADPYFRIQRVRPGRGEAALEPSFAVLVVTSGEGALRTERGAELALHAGMTALVPFAAGATVLAGELEVIRCLPPDPAAGDGDW